MRFDESFASDIKTKKTNHNSGSLVEQAKYSSSPLTAGSILNQQLEGYEEGNSRHNSDPLDNDMKNSMREYERSEYAGTYDQGSQYLGNHGISADKDDKYYKNKGAYNRLQASIGSSQQTPTNGQMNRSVDVYTDDYENPPIFESESIGINRQSVMTSSSSRDKRRKKGKSGKKSLHRGGPGQSEGTACCNAGN